MARAGTWVTEPALQQPRPVVIDQPVLAGQPQLSTRASVAPPAAQSMLPCAAWQTASSVADVSEPALQQPRPVVTDQPKPAGQPHASAPVGSAAPAGGLQSVLPRVARQVASSAACAAHR